MCDGGVDVAVGELDGWVNGLDEPGVSSVGRRSH